MDEYLDPEELHERFGDALLCEMCGLIADETEIIETTIDGSECLVCSECSRCL